MHRPIYLDHQSTTPLDPRVLEAMLPYFTEAFGNPASNTHSYGWEANAAVEQSREAIAQAIQADPSEIIFTSGATEANNLAIKGVAEAYLSAGRHIVTVETEHNAVLDPGRYLETLGFEITRLPVQEDGLLDLARLEASLRADTLLVSVMAANNEIGVVQPLEAIGQLCRDFSKHLRRDSPILFHTDAAQALGKMPLDVRALGLGLMSLTAHKIYGPKGIGALYVSRRDPRVQLAPQLHGGGHERGMRSGTLYPPQIVGFARAVTIAVEQMAAESARQTALRDRLYNLLLPLGGVLLNGHPTQRLAGNLNVSFENVEGQALLSRLQPIVAVSSGSACTSATLEPSHVLKAIGRSDSLAHATLRFGLGRFTTAQEIDTVAHHLVEIITALRNKTPT